MAYTDKVTRSTSNEVPESVAAGVLKVATQKSIALQLIPTQSMPSRTERIAVQNSLPSAFWQTGANQVEKDSSYKQTTTMDWSAKYLYAEELAVLVPIPDALVQDEAFNIFGELRDEIGAAFGRKIDAAILWGDDAPSTWTDAGLYDGAVGAGNVLNAGTNADIAKDVAQLAEAFTYDGFDITGFGAEAGFRWRLIQMRGTDGQPIYAPPAGDQPSTLFGEQLALVRNGSWDRNRASLVMGQWDMARIGIRQDLTFAVSDSATITDGSGNVTYSAFQQDGKVLRAVMRIGFAVANPITALNTNSGTRYPFAFLTKAGAPSS